MTAKRQPKHQILGCELRRQLLQMAPGDSFLTMKEIMGTFAVSQATVTKALESLYDEKLLCVNRGPGGAFVTEEVLRYKKGAPPTICLAVPRWNSGVNMLLENKFMDLSERFKYRPEIVPFKTDVEWQDAMDRLRGDAILVIPQGDVPSQKNYEEMKASGKPFAVFGFNLPGINSVWADPRHCGLLAAKHLVDLGHQRLAVILSEPKLPVILERATGFTDYAALNGIPCDVVDCGIKPGDFAVENVHATTKSLLAAGRPPFTGVFVTSAQPALGVMNAIQEAGLRIPGDISVISCIGDEYCRFFFPALTLVNEDFDHELESIIKLLMRNLKSGTDAPPREYPIYVQPDPRQIHRPRPPA
jgi:DNA-binding LacI/PurR family transcriptional regulator